MIQRTDPCARSAKVWARTVCTEMRKRGVSLKLSDEHPSHGTLFAKECQSEIIDEQQRKSFLIRFTGDGYAWTNITGGWASVWWRWSNTRRISS